MENIRQLLITEPQVKKIQAILSNLYNKESTEEAREKLKLHYNIPSFWQLTREEASEIIEKLIKIESERTANQPRLF